MAVKKKTRSKAKSKKSNLGRNLLIVGAVAGAGWATWKFLIQPRLQAKAEAEKLKADAEAQAKGGEQAVSSAIATLQTITPNTLPAGSEKKNSLSPIGTPFNKINYNARCWYGSKGAEVQFIQSAYNTAIRWLNAKNSKSYYTLDQQRTPIATDGIWGNETSKALKSVFTPEQIKAGITPKIALAWRKKIEDTFATSSTGNIVGGTFGSVIANIGN